MSSTQRRQTLIQAAISLRCHRAPLITLPDQRPTGPGPRGTMRRAAASAAPASPAPGGPHCARRRSAGGRRCPRGSRGCTSSRRPGEPRGGKRERCLVHTRHRRRAGAAHLLPRRVPGVEGHDGVEGHGLDPRAAAREGDDEVDVALQQQQRQMRGEGAWRDARTATKEAARAHRVDEPAALRRIVEDPLVDGDDGHDQVVVRVVDDLRAQDPRDTPTGASLRHETH